jgi:hypothetical protein
VISHEIPIFFVVLCPKFLGLFNPPSTHHNFRLPTWCTPCPGSSVPSSWGRWNDDGGVNETLGGSSINKPWHFGF